MKNVAMSWKLGPLGTAAIAGIGGFMAISGLAAFGHAMHVMLVIAPFGATSVLIFAAPKVPFAQPRHVIGGHLISAAIGVLVLLFCGSSPLAMGFGVGLSIALMMLTDTVHPPAGADPLVALAIGAPWWFPLLPVLAGAVTIVLVGFAYHRWISRQPYPTIPWRPKREVAA